jgi:inosine-uridine nucleoside N-ribohydrolase
MEAAARAMAQRNCRRLIIDTDLGLDDLVALSILRLQQCISSQQLSVENTYTNFHICGVTLTSGISIANNRNAALLSRLLPPGTPVYVGNSCQTSSWNSRGAKKPMWWNRTASRVESFLSSLTDAGVELERRTQSVSAEEYIADNLDDPDVDILCMAPLTNVAQAIDLFKTKHPSDLIHSRFHIMGGILNDSKWTKRGESTAPFGYHDTFASMDNSALESNSKPEQSPRGQFGEFNFALDIDAVRKVLANISAHVMTLEACTLVPSDLRADEPSINLATVLANNSSETEENNELQVARNNLIKLLNEFGTNETQWDSISAAIYCNAFPLRGKLTHIRRSEMTLSDLGSCAFPGQINASDDVQSKTCGDVHDNSMDFHFIHPAFTEEDEFCFYDFLSSILFDKMPMSSSTS